MTVKELMDELKKYDESWEIRIAWFSYGNYSIIDVPRGRFIHQDSYEDDHWNVIESKDVVLDLGDFTF